MKTDEVKKYLESISVSDVVMIDNDIYYVDNFGFKKI